MGAVGHFARLYAKTQDERVRSKRECPRVGGIDVLASRTAAANHSAETRVPKATRVSSSSTAMMFASMSSSEKLEKSTPSKKRS
jgi:hypothetical protein